jgi:macrolide transport system ATP-binding/permease protein
VHADALTLLEMIGLSKRLDHKPNEISGGQQQRVAIARALINKPLIIFADEPTGNLDTKTTKEIIKILKDLNNSGITIVMVTHEPELAAYATRTITVQDGLIVADEQTELQKKKGGIRREKKVSQKSFSIIRIRDYFVQAYRSLKGNKMRSILSILGVMIGVSSLGSNLLMVSPGASQKGGISQETGAFMRLKSEDIGDLKNNIKGIKAISGYCIGRSQIVANGHNHNTRLEGVSPDYIDLRDSYPASGRFFTKEEDLERKKVILLGETVVKEIYGDKDFNPIGEYIKVNRIDFQVIGVLPTTGSKGWKDEDDKVLIPLNTALRRVFGVDILNYLDVQVKDNSDMSKVSEDIITRLLFTHRMPSTARDAVRVLNMADIQEAMSAMARAFSLLLGSIAFISLLVGGIGIMNIMCLYLFQREQKR